MIFLILLSVGLNAIAQVIMRQGMRGVEFEMSLGWLFARMLSPGVMGGMLCYLLSFFLWLVVLSRVQVSVAYPFQALGYVFASLVAWRFLGEGMTLLNIAGLALVCTGVLVLSRSV